MTSQDGVSSPYHPGEQWVQQQVGVQAQAERAGRKLIRDFMPDDHRELFGKLPFAVVGSVDAQGRRWASLLSGPSGFMTTPDPRCLRVAALPASFDPLAASLAVGQPLGILGIEFATRRRNRMNGRVRSLDGLGFEIDVVQSFGNCPKYITPRDVAHRVPEKPPSASIEAAHLSEVATRLIARADTCFIATASLPSAGPSAPHGVDVSHRGGPPGFVEVRREDTSDVLMLPDYRGNNAFNTLGNLVLEPRAGLTFFDVSEGHLLYLSCRAELVWTASHGEHRPAAERWLALHVEGGWLVANGLPLRFSDAPLNPTELGG